MRIPILILLILSALAFCSPEAAGAGRHSENQSVQSALRSQIASRIEVPDFIHENNTRNDYKAVVRIRPDGRILTESSQCANAELKSYVETELRRLRLEQELPSEDTRIVLIIRFKVL